MGKLEKVSEDPSLKEEMGRWGGRGCWVGRVSVATSLYGI